MERKAAVNDCAADNIQHYLGPTQYFYVQGLKHGVSLREPRYT